MGKVQPADVDRPVSREPRVLIRPDIGIERHHPLPSFAAAGSSSIHVSVPAGRTATAGARSSVAPPSSTSFTTSALPAPPTRNSAARAALIVGNVNVTRSTGGGSTPGGLAV